MPSGVIAMGRRLLRLEELALRLGRTALVVLVFAHGVAHSLGFFLPWRAAVNGTPFDTTLFGGRIDVGTTGMLAVAVLYMAVAIAFVISAISIASDLAGWPRWTTGVTVFSLALTVPGWPGTQIGVYLDLALLALLMVVSWRGVWHASPRPPREERGPHPTT